MVERLYSRLDLQLVTLSVSLFFSALLSYLLGFTPLLRFSFATLIYGSIGGIVLVLSEIAFVFLSNKSQKRSYFESYFSKEAVNTVTFSKSVAQAAGEETLLRGFIFVPLTNSLNFFGFNLIAFFINALISIAIYSNSEKISYFRGIQATVLGIIYLGTSSIFAVILARFIGEVCLILASYYKLPNLIFKRFLYVNSQAV